MVIVCNVQEKKHLEDLTHQQATEIEQVSSQPTHSLTPSSFTTSSFPSPPLPSPHPSLLSLLLHTALGFTAGI